MPRSMSEPDVLRTTIGDIDLEEVHLRLGGREWHILHSGAIVSTDDEQRFLGREQRLPYGIVLWPSAIALAHELATRSLEGRRVLELGAGTGLPGIVAATLGANVVQTDKQDVALHVCKRNAERNGVTIAHRAADWTTWEDRQAYDLILASDVLYATEMHTHLRAIFETNLAPGGAVLVADPLRKQSFALLETLEEAGWKISMSKWSVGIEPPPRTVGVFELSRRSSSAPA